MQKSATQRLDFPTTFLFVITVFMASVRLAATRWTPGIALVEATAFLAALLGLALGKSSFGKGWIVFLTIGYSLVVLPWQLSRAIATPLLSSFERILSMSERLSLALAQLSQRAAVEDPLLFLAVMLILFWMISLYSGYAFVRYRSVLTILLPTLIPILLIQYYDGRAAARLWTTGFYFLFALLLLGRLNYLHNRAAWKEGNIFISPDIRFDINIITMATITAALLVSWSIPGSRAEWRAAAKWWRETMQAFDGTREQLDNALSAVENDTAVSVSSGILYGAQLPLGERAYQGDAEMLVIRAPIFEDPSLAPPRYYWRMRSYDTYRNGVWSHSPNIAQESIAAMTDLATPDIDRRTIGEFIVTNKAEIQNLYITAQQPVWLSEEAQAVYTRLPDGAWDIDRLVAESGLVNGDAYAARSALIAPTIADLRLAGTTYPDWVTARYLQLPADLPANIRDLALLLTNEMGTPYDKARAITTYLRTEIGYSESIPPVPRGRDPLAWFLFEWKQGYCNYAASAEVIMLRAAGVPARIVVGFSQGKRDKRGNFVVLQKNAHAWPEVYFPHIGWVEFEPTGNQSRLVRPAGTINRENELLFGPGGVQPNDELGKVQEDIPENEIIAPETIAVNAKKRLRLWLFWGMIILSVAGAGAGIWHLNRKQALIPRALRLVVRIYDRNQRRAPDWLIRWMRWSEASPIMRAFHSVNRGLRWLHNPAPPYYTPAERAAALQTLLPEQGEDIAVLLREYQSALYSPREGDLQAARTAQRNLLVCLLKKKLYRS